jgi:hypothetical protein
MGKVVDVENAPLFAFDGEFASYVALVFTGHR